MVGKGGVLAAFVFGEHGDGDDREGEDGALAFGVEPFQEVVLQRGDAFPFGLAEIGEDEVAEHRVEVVLVVEGDVPEGALVAARGGGLVDGVNDVLQVVGDVAFVGAQVVVAVIFAREVVKIGEEFNGGDCPGELRADGEDEVHKRAAEGGEMLRRAGFAAEFGHAVAQEGVHRDGDAVGLEAGFVVDVDFVRLYLADVFGGGCFAKQLADFAADLGAVYLNHQVFHQLGFQCRHVFLGDVGIGVQFGTIGGVVRTHVVIHKVQFLLNLFG